MRRLACIVGLATVVAAGAWWLAAARRGEPPPFRPEAPVAVDVVVDFVCIGTIAEPAALMAVLRRGRPVEPHACIARGDFVLHYASGESVRVLFLPGHVASRYEFGVGGAGYSVRRKPLLAALAAGGIDVTRFPQE